MTNQQTHPSTHLKHASRVEIPAVDKVRMRSALVSYTQQNPVHIGLVRRFLPGNARVIPSPYYRFILTQPMSIIAVIIAALLVGGGTSYAAQGSLPGDVLYPVKVHVNEPVEEALALSPQAQANVQASIAATRLSEAQQLAVKGTLSTSTAAQLAANFASHAKAATQKADALAATDPTTAAEINASLDARIAANKSILETLASEGSDGPAVNGIVASLTAHLSEHGRAATASSTALAHLPTQAFTALADRAQRRLFDAQNTLADVLQHASTSASASATFLTQARAAIQLATKELSTASSSLTAGNKVAAYTAYAASLNASTQAKAYLDAATRVRDEAQVRAQAEEHATHEHGNATSSAAHSKTHGQATSHEASQTNRTQSAEQHTLQTQTSTDTSGGNASSTGNGVRVRTDGGLQLQFGGGN